MIKNIIIALLAFACGFTTYVAVHNSRPICDDLVRFPNDYTHELVCEVGLGDIPEDQANVIMVPIKDHGQLRELRR